MKLGNNPKSLGFFIKCIFWLFIITFVIYLTFLHIHNPRTLLFLMQSICLILLILLLICTAFYRCYFLRQPERNIPYNKDIFISPANGKIIAILKNPTEHTILYKENNQVLDNFIEGIGEGATMVSIMMTPMNVHYQRSPNNATLIENVYVRGAKRNAMKKDPTMKSTLQNEYNSMLFEMNNGVHYRVIQIAGALARRIVSYIDIDDTVGQGDVIGLIKFGSQVTIIFDKNVDVIAKVGDKVIDGETILGKLKHNKLSKK